MVSSEAVPFSKTGGLADVTSSLSIALGKLGNDVHLALPCYGITDDSDFIDLPCTLLIPFAWGDEVVRCKQREIDGITVYLFDHHWFRNRKGIYGENTNTPYSDNLLRFTLLAKGALALCEELHWTADILHCHDWPAGFIPFLAKQDSRFSSVPTVFTIHNLAYQGEFPRLDLLLTDMRADGRMLMGSGIKQRVNMLKTGLEFTDIITTVSPSYAKEIQTSEYGCGLEDLLRSRSHVLFGILNGIDTQEWDPATDRFLPVHYSADDLSKKKELKKIVQQRFDLPLDPNIPLIGMISRIVQQKGFVELCQGSPCALEQILDELGVQMVIIGTGEKELEERLSVLAEINPNLAVYLAFSNEAAHLVEGASDFFLMPSRYEPCGLNQMYSLRYGTIPIARRTGGLADSIVGGGEGQTGFLFDEMSGAAIFEAVKEAVNLYRQDPVVIEAMRKRGMQADFSWRQSAEEYMKIYKRVRKE